MFDSAMAWRMLPIDADLVIATNFPSYFVRHPRKVVWLFHQHRVAYDLAGSELSDFDLDDGALEEQRLLVEWDTRALEEATVRYTLSAVVSDRLARYNGLTSTPLPHPPPHFDRLHPGQSDGSLFTALRLERNKRPELLIDAMAEASSDLTLHIAGTGSLHDELAARIERHGLTGRVHLLGWTSDDEVVRRYEAARAVLYTPYDEDYGYVTLQAFAAGKPVVTASDAGAVLEWVTDGVNGLVADPTPKSLAAAIDRIATDDVLDATARKGGEGARRVVVVGAGRRGAAHGSDGAMTFPRLGVVTGAERADAVAPLLQALSDRCHVVAWHPGLPVDAVFVASWRAPRALDASKEAGGRVVLWDDVGDPPRRMARPGHHHDLDAGARGRCPAVPGNRAVHARALARTVRHRAARRAADGPLLAAAAHVPCAVSGGRCNRNHCARGAGLCDATGDGLGDCVTARRNRPRRHARVRR